MYEGGKAGRGGGGAVLSGMVGHSQTSKRSQRRVREQRPPSSVERQMHRRIRRTSTDQHRPVGAGRRRLSSVWTGESHGRIHAHARRVDGGLRMGYDAMGALGRPSQALRRSPRSSAHARTGNTEMSCTHGRKESHAASHAVTPRAATTQNGQRPVQERRDQASSGLAGPTATATDVYLTRTTRPGTAPRAVGTISSAWK